MNIDWVTISVGHLDNPDVRQDWFRRMRNVIGAHHGAFTSSYFGAYTISLPGRVWQRFEDEADGVRLVADIMNMCASSHITRVDFAFDWIGEDVPAVWDAFGENLHITRVSGDGNTWYVGSRESSFYARLYNKKAELKARTGVEVEGFWSRFEVEVKRGDAPELYRHFLRSRLDVIAYLFKRYHLEAFTPVAGGDIDSIRRVKPPEIDAFAFVRRFQRVIRKARGADPRLFDELIMQ